MVRNLIVMLSMVLAVNNAGIFRQNKPATVAAVAARGES